MKLILLRHGESEWNLLNKFTGWTDVDLTENGINEAKWKAANEYCKDRGWTFQILTEDHLFTNK